MTVGWQQILPMLKAQVSKSDVFNKSVLFRLAHGSQKSINNGRDHLRGLHVLTRQGPIKQLPVSLQEPLAGLIECSLEILQMITLLRTPVQHRPRRVERCHDSAIRSI